MEIIVRIIPINRTINACYKLQNINNKLLQVFNFYQSEEEDYPTLYTKREEMWSRDVGYYFNFKEDDLERLR